MTCFFLDSFESRMTPRYLAEWEKGLLWEPTVIESGRKWWNVSSKTKREREELLFCRRSVSADFRSSMFLCHLRMALSSLVRLVKSGFLELCIMWGWSLLWEERISGAVYHLRKLMIHRVVSYDTEERSSVQDEENGPQHWALMHTVHELWWWWRRVTEWSGLIFAWEIWLKPLECSRLNAQNRPGGRGEFGGQ